MEGRPSCNASILCNQQVRLRSTFSLRKSSSFPKIVGDYSEVHYHGEVVGARKFSLINVGWYKACFRSQCAIHNELVNRIIASLSSHPPSVTFTYTQERENHHETSCAFCSYRILVIGCGVR